jgi:hypothetical protein
MNSTSEDKWRALIAAQERSGLGVRRFAESRGLAPATMYWWRSRLRDRSTASPLVPVAIVSKDVRIEREPSETSRAFFEVVVGATTLRVLPGFDDDELRRVLRALRC